MNSTLFEVKNNMNIILVIGMTGAGKSSFVNYITNKYMCKASDSASTSTQEYIMVEMIYNSKTLYFFDTPGLDDPNSDIKNVEKMIHFRNVVPKINTIIYCQKLIDHRYTSSTKILFNLMKDLYGSKIFEHLIIVRTDSDSDSNLHFQNDKKASKDFIDKIKTEFSIDDRIKIPHYYIDSYRDNDSENEKKIILDELEKMDPIINEVKKTIEEVIDYDSLNNRYIIKERIEIKYNDFDKLTQTKIETYEEIKDFKANLHKYINF